MMMWCAASTTRACPASAVQISERYCEHHPRLSGVTRRLFAFMYRNALRAPDRFALPADRFLELSRQVAL